MSSSSYLLVGALEESICKLAIVILFLFWNNKSQDFGGQIGGLAKCVDAILTRSYHFIVYYFDAFGYCGLDRSTITQ